MKSCTASSIVAEALTSWTAEVYQADRQESNLPRFLPSRSRLRCLRSAAANSPARFLAFELVEMERNQRWAWCCGGGGGVPEADPELAQWSAADRMREARASGAELMLTSSALCQRSFGELPEGGSADRRFTRVYFTGALIFNHAQRTSFHTATNAQHARAQGEFARSLRVDSRSEGTQ